MELQRAVHHGIVLIPIAFVQKPRKIGMETLVMAHHTRAEIVKTRYNGYQHDDREDHDFICDYR